MKQIHNIHGEIAVQYTMTTKSIHMQPHGWMATMSWPAYYKAIPLVITEL